VTFDRKPILTTELGRQCLRRAWQSVSEELPFRLDAVCLLPDHLHCVWTLPQGDADFSNRWREIKRQFSHRFLKGGGTQGKLSPSRERRGEVAIWQRRFWEHWVRDSDEHRRFVDYIHYNPVKHGYVTRPADWPWSTFRKHVRMGWYNAGWGAREPESIVNLHGPGE
jgi:putative transposase